MKIKKIFKLYFLHLFVMLLLLAIHPAHSIAQITPELSKAASDGNATLYGKKPHLQEAKDSHKMLLNVTIVDISEIRDIYDDGHTELTLVFKCEYGNQKDKREILVMFNGAYDDDLDLNEGDSIKLRLDATSDKIAYLEYNGKRITVVIEHINAI